MAGINTGIGFFIRGAFYTSAMNGFPLDYGVIERWGRFLLKPMLHVTHRGPRKTETVAVRYSVDASSSTFDFAGSTASVTTTYKSEPSHRTGESRYIRVWVYNEIGFPARQCEVFVERIWLDERLIDDERSPLHWTDIDGAYDFPMIRRGYRNGHYIDVCASDSIDTRLQVISRKGLKGYHRFDKPGMYKFELSAEASTPCSFGRCRREKLLSFCQGPAAPRFIH